MKKALLAACAGCVIAGLPVHAAPKVTVSMQREAFATWNMGTVVFAPGQGDCAQAIVDKMTAMLSRRSIVAGPVNLPSVISQHRLKFPTFLKAADVTALGKHVGADTMFLVRTTQCTYPQSTFNWEHPTDWLGIEDKSKTVYVTSTRATIGGTVQLLDLKTGKILKPIPVEATPEITYTSEKSYADAAPAEKVRGQGFDEIVSQVEIVFFPWTEKKEVVFYDDKDCNLKQASALMKTGDVKGALELSRKNAEECRTNPKRGDKQKRNALHNLATVLYAAGDYEGALPLYEEAMNMKGGDDQKRGAEACKRRINLRDSVRQLDQQIAAATLTPY